MILLMLVGGGVLLALVVDEDLALAGLLIGGQLDTDGGCHDRFLVMVGFTGS
jgi:hypothetical protein